MARDDRTAHDPEPLDLPRASGPLADTHAHLDMLEDPAGALAAAAEAGLSFVATIADCTEAPERTYEGLEGWRAEAAARLAGRGVDAAVPDVRIIVGVHPHNAKEFTPDVAALMRRLAADPRTCGIGEVGLDFHYDHSPRDDQRAMMRAHLAVARELGLPVCVHLREAHDEGLAILAEAGISQAGCVIHCFTEGPETAARFLELGCIIAFGGVVTFPKAGLVREAVAAVPLARMLLETDCPFLAPAPYRGRTNEPALVALTAAKVAEVAGATLDEVATATTANALAFYGRRG